MSRFYLTTSIAYVNAPPHLGFALELVQADVVARWHRQKGDDVFFLTGVDEHGAKITRAAAAQLQLGEPRLARAGREATLEEIKNFVDENAAKFQALKSLLNISWDDFIRTSDQKKHWPQVTDLWNKLAAAGDIYKKNYKGLYCVGHEAFVTEKDLLAPSGVEGSAGICKDHGRAPEVLEEENYFFRLSKYALQVAEKIKSGELKIIPEGRAKEILNFIEQGMEDISFSRPRKDLGWGVPVPNDDLQTIYVWADALANYLYPKNQWPADVHFIGKDILRFHALYWPAMLFSANLSLPKALFVHGHITVDGQKMSKTLGNVIDPVELVKKYGAEAVRYYLLREIPPTDDGDFSYKKFEERYNADLANGLGNFTARVLALALQSNPNLRTSHVLNIDGDIKRRVADVQKLVDQKLSEYKFHEALAAIWALIAFGDAYVNEKKPWATSNVLTSDVVILELLFILQNIAELLNPFLPETAQKIRDSIEKKQKICPFPRLDNGTVLK